MTALLPEKQLDITEMLSAWSKGDDHALADVMPLVYDDLESNPAV